MSDIRCPCEPAGGPQGCFYDNSRGDFTPPALFLSSKTGINPEFGKIRTVEVNGEPWLVGKDVALALGYSNPRDALAKHVDLEDKGVAKCDTPSGTQEMTIINESGLYSLVLSSKLPGAKKFRRWVTSEVLPSIRKTEISWGYSPPSCSYSNMSPG